MQSAVPYITEDSRWRALAGRDPAAADAFCYGVRTTGIYCRPGCRSRRPRRENVEFFESPDAAERAGYRPCKRCRPASGPAGPQRHSDRIAAACRRLEGADEAPTLAELAAAAGLSRWHFQRLFKSEVGVTPRQYFAATRARRLREQLRSGRSVTDAILDSGFGSASSGYAGARQELAMTPSSYREGGAGERIRVGTAPCSLGWIAVASTERGICAIELADDAASARQRIGHGFPRARIAPAPTGLEQVLAAVVALVESPGQGIELPLDIRGTAFRRRVWQALREVPPGTTVSYAELAARIGRPGSARAVAGACAANPLAVAVPCHRVLRSDGGLGGYRWGLARKRALLEREQPDDDQSPA